MSNNSNNKKHNSKYKRKKYHNKKRKKPENQNTTNIQQQNNTEEKQNRNTEKTSNNSNNTSDNKNTRKNNYNKNWKYKKNFRKKHSNKENNYPKPKKNIVYEICPMCEKKITEPFFAIKDAGTGKNCHFECIQKQVAEKETLEPGEKIYYLGGGNFGIVLEKRYRGRKKIIISKKIPYIAQK